MTLTITVLTVADRPTFTVPVESDPVLVRKLVANRFGYVSIGVPHSWIGTLSS